MNKQINLLLASTKDQFIHIIEVLYSVAKTCSRDINLYIIIDDTDISYYKNFIERLCINTIKTVNVYNSSIIDSMNLADIYAKSYFTRMCFGRIAFMSIAGDIDRYLYLDTDALAIRPGIENFYDIDLAGKYAAVIDEVSAESFQKNMLAEYGLTRYFNSGVMVFNLQQIRADGIDEKLLSELRNPSDISRKYRGSDQDILNYIFKDNAVFANPIFNIQSHMFGFSQYDKLAVSYGYKNQFDMINNCVISHTTGAKAWDSKWDTWQAWQLPYKQWQRNYYLSIKNELLKKYSFIEELYK